MGNCALKPKVLTETGAPAPEKIDDHLVQYQKLDDTEKSLGHLLLEGEGKEKPDEDGKITSEAEKQKDPETGDRTASVETTQKQALWSETTEPETEAGKRSEKQEMVEDDDDGLERKVEDKKIVEDVPMKVKVNRVRTEDEKENETKEEERRTELESK